jgi:hypothetical protein
MKKILILSSGNVGKHFVQRVIDTYTSENIYYIVELRANSYEGATPARFKFFEFDPTSFYKLSNILKMDFVQAIVAMEKRVDVENTIKNIKLIKKNMRVIALDSWGLDFQDTNTVLINTNDILASKLIDFLPNVPVIAQNVGLGEGEIMEVSVPFGSSYVYKHLGVIEQKNWKIVAIYRNRQLLLPTRRRMIQPNDILLLVGDPRVLKTVYKVIKRELGQFPEPFGTSLYLFVDMQKNSYADIVKHVQHARYIQNKLSKELFIRIVNPNNIDLIWYIKDFTDDNTHVLIKYDDTSVEEQIALDQKAFHFGLVIISNELFYAREMRKILYKTFVPVLKLAHKPVTEIKDVALIVADSKDPEKISNAIFDFSEQFEFNIELYNYLNESQDFKEQVIEHYNNLAVIFSKSIKVYKEEENPIRILQKKENFLHVVPFSKKLLRRRFYSYFSTDSDLMYHFLESYHQMFIPVDDI